MCNEAAHCSVRAFENNGGIREESYDEHVDEPIESGANGEEAIDEVLLLLDEQLALAEIK